MLAADGFPAVAEWMVETKWQLDWIRRLNNSDGSLTGACTFATQRGTECGAPCRRVINRLNGIGSRSIFFNPCNCWPELKTSAPTLERRS